MVASWLCRRRYGADHRKLNWKGLLAYGNFWLAPKSDYWNGILASAMIRVQFSTIHLIFWFWRCSLQHASLTVGPQHAEYVVVIRSVHNVIGQPQVAAQLKKHHHKFELIICLAHVVQLYSTCDGRDQCQTYQRKTLDPGLPITSHNSKVDPLAGEPPAPRGSLVVISIWAAPTEEGTSWSLGHLKSGSIWQLDNDLQYQLWTLVLFKFERNHTEHVRLTYPIDISNSTKCKKTQVQVPVVIQNIYQY